MIPSWATLLLALPLAAVEIDPGAIAPALGPAAAAPPAPAVHWLTSYEDGLAAAKKQGQPVLLDFSADWCGWCRVMDREVYGNPRVIKLARQFVCVKIDVDRNPKPAVLYQVSSLPRTIILDQEGKNVGDLLGYVDADRFSTFLQGVITNAEVSATAATLADPVTARDPEVLVGLLGHADRTVRERAAELLAELGRSALPALVRALNDDYLGTRLTAHQLLQRLTADAAGTPTGYDPWADKPHREQSAAAWQHWLEGQSPPAATSPQPLAPSR